MNGAARRIVIIDAGAPPLDDAAADAALAEATRGAMLVVAFDGGEGARAALAKLHERYAARGVPAVRAYVNVLVRVDAAFVARGASALVDELVRAGAVYVEVAPAPGLAIDEYAAFYRRFLDALLDRNARGTLLVEKRLALELEVIAEVSRRGAALPLAPGDPPAACATCRYDPFCGHPLLRGWLADEADAKACGTRYCARSLAAFDELFARLASPDASPPLRRAFAAWMAARDDIARSRG